MVNKVNSLKNDEKTVMIEEPVIESEPSCLSTESLGKMDHIGFVVEVFRDAFIEFRINP